MLTRSSSSFKSASSVQMALLLHQLRVDGWVEPVRSSGGRWKEGGGGAGRGLWGAVIGDGCATIHNRDARLTGMLEKSHNIIMA